VIVTENRRKITFFWLADFPNFCHCVVLQIKNPNLKTGIFNIGKLA